jgi:hypothetical protein
MPDQNTTTTGPRDEGLNERLQELLLGEEFQYAMAEEIVRLRAHIADPDAEPPEEVPEGDPLFMEIDHGLRAALAATQPDPPANPSSTTRGGD